MQNKVDYHSKYRCKNSSQSICPPYKAVVEKVELKTPGKTSFEQLFDLVVPAHLSYYEVAKMYHIGIPSISIQKKFSISGDTIRLFAKNELIDIVGQQEYTDKDGNIKKANLYDTFAYYTLTPSKIRKWVKIITESKEENRTP